MGTGALIAIISVLSIFVGCPAIIFAFIYKTTKGKREIEKLKHQQRILELELEKENTQIRMLEEENKKLDRIIDQR